MATEPNQITPHFASDRHMYRAFEHARMVPDGSRDRYVLAGITLLAVLTLLYTVLIAGRPLLWFSVVIPLVLLYFAWRFVRAVERIADALEDGAGARVERQSER